MGNNSANQFCEELQYKTWNNFFCGNVQTDKIVIDYLLDNMSLRFLEDNQSCFSEEKINDAVTRIMRALLSTPVSKIQELLKKCDVTKAVMVKNIPQFSNFASATIYVPEVLFERKTPLTYKELGYIIYADSVSDEAATKYGENHGKLAVLLDLAMLKKHNGTNVFECTRVTEYFCKLDECEKVELIRRLCYKIPMIQHVVNSENPNIEIDGLLKRVMAYSTYLRRRSNALEVLAFALEE